MQTFLPYDDFKKSALVLDRRRLGKQRVEAMQILSILAGRGKSGAWINHPAVKMWRGYEWALFQYIKAVCAAWTGFGYKDTCLEKSKRIIKSLGVIKKEMPPWLGRQDFHNSHRSNLLRKNKEFYARYFNNDISDDLPYIWPV
jgi:hypothetical protein